MDMRQLVKILFERGREKEIKDMEVFIQRKKNLNIRVFKGEIDNYSISDENGLSFRGIYNGKMGYSYTEKLDESSIDILIKEVIDNAKIIDSNDAEYIFEGSNDYKEINNFNEELENISNEEKVNFVKSMEQEALKADKRVEAVNYCIYGEGMEHNLLINTKGLDLENKSNTAHAYISVMVKENDDIKTGANYGISNNYRDFDFKTLSREAVHEGISMLGANSIESDNYPIILRNDAAASLLNAYSNIFSAENVQKGLSLLKGKINHSIANSIITLVDDPFMEGGIMLQSFDGEGVASKKKNVIEKGVLKTYLYNLKTAKKDGVKSTGNGYKASYKSVTSISPTNMYIEKGNISLEKMIEKMKKGIVITAFQGLHAGVNIVSGDFSLSAHGYLIENGKLSRPINQITVAGNFYDMLKNVEELGDDLKFAIPRGGGYIGSPSLKIKELSISGK
ncbi:TldD/PmbA family protein [Paramaledivibacter caminithermalis]|jgi:PmbA protein|uniref:PmbA protein n=1 Tax=Paramaledivibacter caminithermalis (strain DSM 15212 / CIP 107654 / DViRD3) TaxID=1121301 RepID=A0A1M6N074_PARC5|nr:TldD/PmbA family protein [Paramaledivibacter caminithermalis]SHJ89091.1 PmbA protein [Paramaledivibacter caminithermalis DSM 15212]